MAAEKPEIEGQPARPFTAPKLVYIPPATRHNIANTGSESLPYVYLVAPVTTPQRGRQPFRHD